jgi:hypothetical protein
MFSGGLIYQFVQVAKRGSPNDQRGCNEVATSSLKIATRLQEGGFGFNCAGKRTVLQGGLLQRTF